MSEVNDVLVSIAAILASCYLIYKATKSIKCLCCEIEVNEDAQDLSFLRRLAMRFTPRRPDSEPQSGRETHNADSDKRRDIEAPDV